MTRNIWFWLSCAVLAVGALWALFPSVFAPYDPVFVDMANAKQPPGAEHWFGTDQSGRDVFSRVVWGAQLSLGVGVLASAIAMMSGLLLGTLLGIAPRWLDAVAVRIVDVMLAVPEFLIALVVVAMLGPGAANVALAVTIAATPVYIKLARGHTQALRNTDYVEAAKLLGVPAPLALTRHVVPAVFRRLSVVASIGIGSAILAASGLSFLGLGVGEPTAEWGLLLSGGRNTLATAWWIAVFPGIAITLTVVAASTIGRILRRRAEEGER